MFFTYLSDDELNMAIDNYIERQRMDFYEEWLEYIDFWD